MFRERFCVQENKGSTIDPMPTLHFARARNVSRYFFMNWRPLVSCFSISGS
jgi:hypothetical protein